MRNNKKVFFYLFALVYTVVIFSLFGCSTVKEANQLNKDLDESRNIANATIIASAYNTNNILSDNDKKLSELPKTVDEFINSIVLQFAMDNEDYEEALPYIIFDEEGEAYLIKE